MRIRHRKIEGKHVLFRHCCSGVVCRFDILGHLFFRGGMLFQHTGHLLFRGGMLFRHMLFFRVVFCFDICCFSGVVCCFDICCFSGVVCCFDILGHLFFRVGMLV